MHYKVIKLHPQILQEISGMQKVWVCHTLSNTLQSYLWFNRKRKWCILIIRMHNIDENKKGEKCGLATNYIQ
jgi:hypothetical protein